MRRASADRRTLLLVEDQKHVAMVGPCGTTGNAHKSSLGADGMLWEQSTPHTIAKTAIDLFGMDAAQAIEWCARSAHHRGRDADLRFWHAVLGRLEKPAKDGKL